MRTNERMRAGWAGVLISAALLSACGGGGDDGAAAVPPPPQGVTVPDNLAIAAAATGELGTSTLFGTNVASTTGLSFAWNFGDGSTSAEAAPKHDYSKAGEYAVTLKVSNATGSAKEVKFTVTVNNRSHVQGLSCTGADLTGWCWQAPRPIGEIQNDYAFADANNGWSVGEQGQILRTTDGGKTWNRQDSGIKTSLTAVTFFDVNNGWAVGDYGAVLRTTDGGKTWVLQAAPSHLGTPTMQADGAGTLLLTGYSGTRMTVDGGANWVEGSALQYEAMLGADGVLWQASYYEGLRKSTDQGRTSTLVVPFQNESLIGYGFSGPNVMVLTSTQTFVSNTYVTTFKARRSLDNGTNWEVGTASGLPANGWFTVQSLSVVSGTEASVVVSNTLYRTTDGGSSWTAQSQPAAALYGVNYSRPARAPGVWMRSYTASVNAAQTLVYEVSADSGVTWQVLPTEYAGGMLERQGTTGWVARGANGTAGLSTDGMRTWTRIGGPDADASKKTFLTSWFFDAKRGLGLNGAGDLMGTADGGLTWTAKSAGLVVTTFWYAYPSRLQFVDDKKGWLQTADGGLLITEDGGSTWVSVVQPTRRVAAYQFLDALNGFALMSDVSTPQKQRVMGTSDGGRSWVQLSELDTFNGGFTGLQFGSASKGVLYGPGGRMMSTEDGGKNWTGRYFGTGGSVRSVRYSDTGTVWAVGDFGQLRVSKNDGVTWEAVANVPVQASLNSVRFLTPQRGWVVGDYGTVLVTSDAGKTWTAQTSGTQQSLTEVQFTDSRTGWIIGSGGTLLATGTGGQ